MFRDRTEVMLDRRGPGPGPGLMTDSPGQDISPGLITVDTAQ